METYVLPYDAVVTDIQVATTNKQQAIAGNFYIISAQYPRTLDGREASPYVEPDLSVYGSNTDPLS